MGRGQRVDVVKGEDVLVLVDFVAGDLAAQDAGEDIVAIVRQLSASARSVRECHLPKGTDTRNERPQRAKVSLLIIGLPLCQSARRSRSGIIRSSLDLIRATFCVQRDCAPFLSERFIGERHSSPTPRTPNLFFRGIHHLLTLVTPAHPQTQDGGMFTFPRSRHFSPPRRVIPKDYRFARPRFSSIPGLSLAAD